MDPITGSATRAVLSSEALPAGLDDEARFRLWRDIYAARYGESDFERSPDRPFFARSEFALFGAVALTRFEVSFSRWTRTARQVAADGRDDFLIGFNRGGHARFTQRGCEFESRGNSGSALFFTNADPGQARVSSRGVVAGICVPRARVVERVAGAEDLIGTGLDPANPAARHLGRYIDFLLDATDLGGDAPQNEYIGTVLLDLVALTLGARREAAALARMRGLRAAHVQAIVAEIGAGYRDPAFSVRDVAAKVRLAPRTVQNLLIETGASFTERVTELRLQEARRMLADPRHDRMKIAEIAWACGFHEVPYFNRTFRRRFGDTPSGVRAGVGPGVAGTLRPAPPSTR